MGHLPPPHCSPIGVRWMLQTSLGQRVGSLLLTRITMKVRGIQTLGNGMTAEFPSCVIFMKYQLTIFLASETATSC